MNDKDSARQQAQQLVDKFSATPKRERDAFTEQQTRVSYILPLFRALGWDTESPAEMSAEEQISRGFVDFGFYLNGVPAFYLETKRVREGVSKPEYMKQAINYSYLKGVTWAVLTDFEDLMVFNAEWEDDNPEKTRFLNLRYHEYANGGFDDLWLLSKESLLTRAIDKAAERAGRKGKREPVTSILFKQLTDWRYRLFQNITTMKTTLWASDPREVDNAVQKLIDRLIFVRSMEDRGVEEPRLKPIVRQTKKGNYFPELITLFRELDGIYNSNLFAQSNLDFMELYDPDLLKEIINGLYKVPGSALATYDFNAIDADVLGAVYEQYLGFKAQDPTAKTKIDPRKREKRKAQGIYYTPKFVVRYIVQQTVGRRLAEGADPHRLRILDPACGSGSSLIEAFDVLDRHIAQTEKDLPAAERRQRILRENLFGVDLDDQAVEVRRLNLALRAAYDREKLPYLTNIKHGNSLIDDAAVAGAVAFKWEEQFDAVMGAGGFDVVIGNPPYVRQESLGDGFKRYAEAHYETYAGTADLYQYFIEKGIKLLKPQGIYGVIVANKWMRANYGKPLRKWLKMQRIEEIIDFGDLPVFADATTYPCIIAARPGVGTPHEASEISHNAQIPDIEQSPDVARTPHEASLHITQVNTLDFTNLEQYVSEHRYTAAQSSLDDNGWSLAGDAQEQLLAKLRTAGKPLGEYAGNSIHYGIKTGLNEAFVIDDVTRKHLIAQDARNADIIKPFLAGRDVKRYEQPDAEHYLILFPNGWTRQEMGGETVSDVTAWAWLQTQYPAIAQYLSAFEAKARKRWDKGEFWWELRPCDYYAEFEKPKIIYPNILSKPEFTFDDHGLYTNQKCFIIAMVK